VFHLKKHQIDDFFSAFVGFDVLKSKNLKKIIYAFSSEKHF